MSVATSNATILKHLDIFLSCSQDLLALANDDNWSEFERLQKKRDANLNQVKQVLAPNVLVNSTLTEAIRVRLQEITTINKALVLLAKKSEASAKFQLKDANHAQKAVAAYRK